MRSVMTRWKEQIKREWARESPSRQSGYAIPTPQILFSSQDQKEGMNAFIEKRKAKFTGK